MLPTDEDAKDDASGENEPLARDESVEVPPSVTPGDEGPAEGSDDGAESDNDAEEARPGRLYRFARKLMDRRELAEDTRELMVAFLSTSDRAKTEMVKMAAREVRTYIEELKLKEDILSLVRNHSLEVKASFSLKPIESALKSSADEEEEG
jgi:hypothetical protein